MYLWRIGAVAKDLKAGRITGIEKIKYGVWNILTIISGLNIAAFLPLLYYATFCFIKSYLEQCAQPATLTIALYMPEGNFFKLLILGIVLLGILICYLTNQRGDGKNFLDRFVCLSVPLNMRIVTITGLLCVGIGGSIASYYVARLLPLMQTTNESQSLPVRVVCKLFNKINIFKHIAQLQEARIIYDEISVASFYASITMHLMTIIITLWFFMRMRSYIAYCSS